MYSFTKREQIVILVIVFIVISIFGYKFINTYNPTNIEDAEVLKINDNLLQEEEQEEINENEIIMVHISGEVYNPGLIELKSGDRINDAVELSGGLKKDADIDRINLSKKLQDEDKIYIPKKGEELEQINLVQDNTSSSNLGGKIDINNCTKEMLISLPGIGEATAEKIIKYRKEIKFKKIEDIMEVSGIGEKKFQAIKDSIVVK